MAQPLIHSATTGAEEAGTKAAQRLWAHSGPKAVTKASDYNRGLRDLPESCTARAAFDRELLRLALADTRIFTPKLPREKKPAPSGDQGRAQ
jgi:hypothetical protein